MKNKNFVNNKKYYTKGFHCMIVKGVRKCLSKSKGRPHVSVAPDTVAKLRKFYKPHNYR